MWGSVFDLRGSPAIAAGRSFFIALSRTLITDSFSPSSLKIQIRDQKFYMKLYTAL